MPPFEANWQNEEQKAPTVSKMGTAEELQKKDTLAERIRANANSGGRRRRTRKSRGRKSKSRKTHRRRKSRRSRR